MEGSISLEMNLSNGLNHTSNNMENNIQRKDVVNYVEQLNLFAKKAASIESLRSSDISIYFALFCIWNRSYWKVPISISRSEVMQISKIGGAKTYTDSIRRLEKAGFLKYEPSHNPMVGSKIYMFIFKPTVNQLKNKKQSTPSQQKPTYINEENSKKKIKTLKTEDLTIFKSQIITFCKDENEGRLFWNWLQRHQISPEQYHEHYEKFRKEQYSS